MTTESEIPVERRILQLFQHLGLEQAHFAAGSMGDLADLATQHPRLFASLTLLCPGQPSREVVEQLATRLLVFRGDTTNWDGLGQFVASLPGATLETLQGWVPWSDLVARHTETIRAAMLPFLVKNAPAGMKEAALLDGERGVVAGISYHIQGAGPPLILLPLGLVPSQWDPIMPTLAQEFCTITLGGAQLGMAKLLEKRATSDGYLGMIRSLVQEAHVNSADSILEVGCGTGALTRWLFRYMEGRNPITGVDVNRYLLRVADDLARIEGLDGMVRFEEGNAENLPYPDNSFDLTMSATVMEEVDADKMLGEMIRVTRPGGRVAVIVRAKDVPFFINLPLSEALKAKVEDPEEWVSAGPRGCADVSLYRRFQASNLTGIKMFPHLATFTRPWALDFVQASLMPILNEVEAAEWQKARAVADAEGTFFWSYPHHCAVGSKPGQ